MARAVEDARRRRRTTLAYRGVLPGRQDPRRARPTPGPPLDLLAPLDHPGDVRARVPDDRNGQRTRPLARPRRAHRTHRRRVPATVHRAATRHHPHDRHAPALVTMAPTTPSPGPSQSLQATGGTVITNYGCRTSSSTALVRHQQERLYRGENELVGQPHVDDVQVDPLIHVVPVQPLHSPQLDLGAST